jgi:hypothetical protein
MMSQYPRTTQETPKTADKCHVTYLARLPDGTPVEKKSFNIKAEAAFLGCYEHGGRWYVSSIVTEPQDWGDQIFVEAQRKW